jgi:hypothetical protein
MLAAAVRGRSQPEEEPAGNGFARRRRPPSGVDGLAVTTGTWLSGVAAVTWVLNPYAAGVLILAAHLWLFAAGGWRGWLAIAAVTIGLLPVLAVGIHYGYALNLDPVGLAWGAALGAAAGSGMWSTLLLGTVLAALAGVVRVLFARRRIARESPHEGPSIKTRGPLSYAGPGSLGGTESALRR